eukprot:UN4694
MFAVFFLYGVTEHLISADPADHSTQELLEYYGSVPAAVLSLFMTISGGIDWVDVMRPLQAIHWIYQLLFTMYVFVMVIGVLNVVMGAFVAATAEISKRDREALVKAEMEEQQAYTRKIKTFFQEADRDRSGVLSWGEFKQHLKIPKVSAYFRALESDVSQAPLTISCPGLQPAMMQGGLAEALVLWGWRGADTRMRRWRGRKCGTLGSFQALMEGALRE